MQARQLSLVAALVAASRAAAEKSDSNPLGTVISLMTDLSAKVTKDKEAEAKAYKEYFAWCDDVAKNTGFEIKTAESAIEKLSATIAELTANIETDETKIGELVSSISTSQEELAAATAVREKEAADFAASEKELVDVVDTLARATTILEREMAKSPAAFAQIQQANMANLVQSLTAVVDAAAFSASDKQRLVALVQQQQDSDEEDGAMGAPAAATYTSKSGSIVDVLEDLKEKAEGELSDLRKAEKNAAHNYAMLKQSLEDQTANDEKDLAATKASKAAAEEKKGTSEGELAATEADLKSSKEALAAASSNCMTVAADHEATVASRDSELKVIAEAIGILKDTTGGAVSQTYSLLQISTHADLARSEVVTLVKKLARDHHSAALAQLASRISAVERYGGGADDDVFAKVKGLITDMISKLEAEAASEATEKAYCDEEMAKTEEKKGELETEISKLTTSIDQATSKSTSLKEEVRTLQEEVATMNKEYAEATAMRQEEHETYTVAKADLEQGLGGIRKALEMLNNYYGGAALIQQPEPPMPAPHDKAGGAAGSIIGILEVCESDFAENLAKEETAESDAAEAYEKMTQEFKLEKTEKTADIKYKTQEFTTLDKTVSELSSDRETANTELSAVLDYYSKLKDRCIAKPETYEQRKARREAEIAGLKEALKILDTETAFLQHGGKKRRRSAMRGALTAGF